MFGRGELSTARDIRFAGKSRDRRMEGRLAEAVGRVDELQIIIERYLGRLLKGDLVARDDDLATSQGQRPAQTTRRPNRGFLPFPCRGPLSGDSFLSSLHSAHVQRVLFLLDESNLALLVVHRAPASTGGAEDVCP